MNSAPSHTHYTKYEYKPPRFAIVGNIDKMQYLLTEKERQDLVPKNDLLTEEAKVQMLVKAFRNSKACTRAENMGYCDDCPIGSLDNGLSPYSKVCPDQEYSK